MSFYNREGQIPGTALIPNLHMFKSLILKSHRGTGDIAQLVQRLPGMAKPWDHSTALHKTKPWQHMPASQALRSGSRRIRSHAVMWLHSNCMQFYTLNNFMCMNVLPAYMYVCVPCAGPEPLETRRGHQTFWN